MWISLEGMPTSLPADTITAPVSARAVVVGAPGSGKTELLMQRCESLLQQGVSVNAVMVVTPTRAAAGKLRDVLGVRLGVATEGARVRSLAALAFALVQDFHHQQGLAPPDLMKASQIDVDIHSLLLGHDEDGSGPSWPEPLGPDVRATRSFRQELREWMAGAGETGASSDELRAAALRAGRADWLAALEFRDEYQRIISSARPGAFDSGEIFARAIAALQHGLPPRWARLQHLLVDDAHDLTHAGLELLLALSRHGLGMTVVSEPDVAGNTFRGSEPAGHAFLAAQWGVTGGVLTHVWRHGPPIRQVVGEVTGRIGAAQAGKQRAAQAEEKESLVQTMLVTSPGAEAFAVAGMIRNAQLEEGLQLGDIAVIARRGTRVSELVRELSLWGIPARQSLSGARLRDQQAARELVELLALGLGTIPLTSRSAVAALQGLYGGMSAQEMRRLRFALRRAAPSDEPHRPVDLLLAEALSHRGGFALLDTGVAHKAHTLAGLLADIADHPTTSVQDALWKLWEGTGAHRSWAQRAEGSSRRSMGINRALDAVVALFAAAADFVESSPGADAAVFIDAILTSEVPEDVVLPTPLWPAVVVSTPSGVVGEQFHTVFITGVEDGVWPDLRLRGSLLASHRLSATLRGVDHESIDEARVVRDDELRLFALALSRAHTRVVVSATQSEESEPSPLFHLVARTAEALVPDTEPPLSPRSIVGSLRRDLVRALQQGWAAEPIAADLALAATWGLPGADPKTWWGLAPVSSTQPLFAEGSIPVSPSALGAIEASPLDWFVSLVARNDPAPSRGVGLLLHQAWEHNLDGDAEDMWREVDRRFGELEYESGWVEGYHKRLAHGMVQALADYTRDRRTAGASVLAIEASFQIEHQRVRLRGMIDRLERLESGEVLVVDLKTGSSQRDKDVVDNPQMLSYQMALDSEEIRKMVGEKLLVSAGAVLVFVKEGVNGKSYRLATQTPLTPEAREAFLSRIEQAAELMSRHEFGGAPRAFGPPGTPARHRWHAIGQVTDEV